MGVYGSKANIAKSFLDGVRIANNKEHQDNMNANEVERIDLQNRQLEATKSFRDRALDLQEASGVRADKMFKRDEERRANQEKIVQATVNKRLQDSEFSGATAKELNQYGIGTNVLGFDVDPDKKRLYVGAPDVEGTDGTEIMQWATPREIAKARAKKKGVTAGEYDPELLKTIKDPAMLDYITKFGGGSEDQGNLLYDAMFNTLGGY